MACPRCGVGAAQAGRSGIQARGIARQVAAFRAGACAGTFHVYAFLIVNAEQRRLHRIACDVGRQCLARRARILSRKLTRIYDDALRPLGLTSSQLGILGAIAAHPGARATELHRRLELEQSSFSRNAALMELRGWIEKRPAEGDRGHELLLTKAGSVLLARAIPRWRTAQREAKRILGDDAQTFAELVDEHC